MPSMWQSGRRMRPACGAAARNSGISGWARRCWSWLPRPRTWWSGAGGRCFGRRGSAARRGARLRPRWGGPRRFKWGVDAEHVAERAQDAAGLGGGVEEFGHVGAGQQMLKLAGAAGGLVAHDVDEPGAASRDFRLFAWRGRRTGAGGAGLGQGSRSPAGEEVLEAVGHAADAAPDENEHGGSRADALRVGGVHASERRRVGDGGAQAGEDGGEEGCEGGH